MAAQTRPTMTEEEYLAFEETAVERHEFLDGSVWAMSGGTAAHDEICLALGGELRSLLDGRPCRAHGQAMRIYSAKTRLYTYPDAAIACGERKFKDDKRTTLLNPQAIFEVLSPSTEAYDRGEKFRHYRSIASVTEYVLLSTWAPRIEVFSRVGDAWSMQIYEAGTIARLPSLDVSLAVDAVYRGVELEPPPPEPKPERDV